MKILYHHRIASKDGQFVHVEEMIKAFRELGHEVLIVGPNIIEDDDFGSEGGLVSKMKKAIPGFAYELLEFIYNLIAFFRIVRAVYKFKPDVIYERYNLYFTCGLWVRKIFNIPIILEINAPIFDERSKYDGISLSILASWTENYCWKNADYVLPVTQVLANRVLKVRSPKKGIMVIPNGIDPDKFDDKDNKEQAKSRLGLEDKLVLGFTGFVREWHGLDRVVDLLARHKNDRLHLLFVGEGPARKQLENQARELNVIEQITFTGLVQRESVAKFLAAFDIALQPDVVEYASPLKLFEYLALGQAIVAPDTPNIREILEDNINALLFDIDNKNAFSNAIERLCNDEVLRMRLGDSAKSLIEERQYRWVNNAEKVVALATQLIR